VTGKPDWAIEGVGWPNREASRFIAVGGLRWHVQVMGEGPTLLLLHGSGAATHSWRDLAPLLARDFRLVAPDLPGHGFTDTPHGSALSIPEMARRVRDLLDALNVEPALAVGHSAGAAVAIRMTLDGRLSPRAIVALNGALLPFPGFTAPLFQGLARAMFANPVSAWLIALRAQDPGRIARLIAGTGSRIDPQGVEFYARLFRRPGHVASTLGMMADWDLETLRRDYPRLAAPLVLAVGENDAAVPPATAEQVRASAPRARVVSWPGLGHLAHEERPDLAAELILATARETGVLPEAEAAA
jgi:magnesium chelatase accessory protein